MNVLVVETKDYKRLKLSLKSVICWTEVKLLILLCTFATLGIL